jgi:hypothetical protein
VENRASKLEQCNVFGRQTRRTPMAIVWKMRVPTSLSHASTTHVPNEVSSEFQTSTLRKLLWNWHVFSAAAAAATFYLLV